jgi:hypothetical protein
MAALHIGSMIEQQRKGYYCYDKRILVWLVVLRDIAQWILTFTTLFFSLVGHLSLQRRSQADQTMCIDEQLTNYGVGPWDQS